MFRQLSQRFMAWKAKLDAETLAGWNKLSEQLRTADIPGLSLEPITDASQIDHGKLRQIKRAIKKIDVETVVRARMAREHKQLWDRLYALSLKVNSQEFQDQIKSVYRSKETQ